MIDDILVGGGWTSIMIDDILVGGGWTSITGSVELMGVWFRYNYACQGANMCYLDDVLYGDTSDDSPE